MAAPRPFYGVVWHSYRTSVVQPVNFSSIQSLSSLRQTFVSPRTILNTIFGLTFSSWCRNTSGLSVAESQENAKKSFKWFLFLLKMLKKGLDVQKIALFAQCESHFKSIVDEVCLQCQLESGTQTGQSCLGPDCAIFWLSWLSPDTVMVDNDGQTMQTLGRFA